MSKGAGFYAKVLFCVFAGLCVLLCAALVVGVGGDNQNTGYVSSAGSGESERIEELEQQRVLEQELLMDLQNSRVSLNKEKELSNQLLQISSAAKQEFEASEKYHKEALGLSEQQRISSERLLKKEKGKTRLLQCLCVVLASVTAGILVVQ